MNYIILLSELYTFLRRNYLLQICIVIFIPFIRNINIIKRVSLSEETSYFLSLDSYKVKMLFNC
jgi:hypothetical protein